MSEPLEQLIDNAMAKAVAQGHRMTVLASGPDTALYVCSDCKLMFTIGYISTSRQAKERRGVQLIADTALTTPCLVRKVQA